MDENLLEIEVQANGSRVVLGLRGELDIASVGTLRSCLESIDSGFREVVLDLTNLRFLDSSAVGLLAEVRRRFEPEMRRLTLHNPRGHVAKVIDLTGLATVLPVTGAGPPPSGHDLPK